MFGCSWSTSSWVVSSLCYTDNRNPLVPCITYLFLLDIKKVVIVFLCACWFLQSLVLLLLYHMLFVVSFLFKKYEFLLWFHPWFIGYSRVTEFPWKIGLQLRSPRQEDHLSPVKCSLIDKSHRPKTKSDAVKYSETKLVWHKPLWGRWISHSQGQSTEQVSGQGYTETHCRACLRKNVRLLDVLVKLAKLKPRQCCEMVCF